jgi:peptidoglycan/LPS O-acetylase OafA/YrhL
LTNDPWLYRFFPTELALFLFGTLAYRIYRKIEHIDIPTPILIIPGLLVFVVIFIYPFIPMPLFRIYNAVNWTLYLFAVIAIPLFFKWTKASRLDSAIGDLSYPIYIAQFIVIDFFIKILKGTQYYEYLPIFVILGCVLVAILVNKLVSDPIEKFRKARKPI